MLVLSQYLDEDYVFALLGDGAQGLGYLLKDRITDGDSFVDAVRRVAAGDAALDPEVVAHLLGSSSSGGPLDELTERERTVLGEMAEGRSNQAIAARLFLSERAVERHVTAIFSKLGADRHAGDAPPRPGGPDLPAGLASAHDEAARHRLGGAASWNRRGGSTRARRRGRCWPAGRCIRRRTL